MNTADEDKKKPAEKYQKVKKVSPLGDLKKEPPTRDEKPQEEFIEKELDSTQDPS